MFLLLASSIIGEIFIHSGRVPNTKNKTGFLATSALSFCSFQVRFCDLLSFAFTLKPVSRFIIFCTLIISITSSLFSTRAHSETLSGASDLITTTQTSAQESKVKSSFTYELNSEFTSLKNSSGYQLDSKFLLGYKWAWITNRPLRVSVGIENYKQAIGDDSQIFTGPLFQFKQSVLQNHLDAMYEHFEYTDHGNKITYNKYGLIFFDYQNLSSLLFSDLYAESFYMPNVSTDKLLTTARASLYLTAPIQALPNNSMALLSEVYHKNSPENWGGEYTDLRLGLRFQPFSFISMKAFTALLSTQKPNDRNFEFQINVFYQEDF